jgi:uncharacterized membrane-anchored protein
MNEEADQSAPHRGPLGMPSHPLRTAVLGEVHSRPFQLTPTPRVILQLAFMNEKPGAGADLESLAALSQSRGLSGPDADARHHSLDWGGGRLRWERHTEFSTWTWDAPAPPAFADPVTGHPFGAGFTAPGLLISAIRLDLRPDNDSADELLSAFDPASLCYSQMDGGLAGAATDFRQDGDGLTRILILDRGLGPARAGALTQRLIEIETYRTLALLGLPEAHRLGPGIRRIEDEMAAITAEMRDDKGRDSEHLLAELIALAADLEAGAAASLYRFGASRAYDEIVAQRINIIGEQPIKGHETWSGFLKRRLGPAMRTCRAVEERQANLSGKLARTANLLRTRIDVELERQNRNLLQSMNRRARLQLRLQQTVEGLSIAAVSYYVVGLVNYLAKGLAATGLPVDPTVATALAVLPVILAIWWIVRRIRRAHAARDADKA